MLEYVEQMAAADPGVRIVRTRQDLEAVRPERLLGLLLTMKGGGALIDDATRVREFYKRGVRTISLTHLRDNEFGGSGSPTIPGTNLHLHPDKGLTDEGRAVLREMAAVGMILDLAHASPQTFADILTEWTGPLFVSHTAMAALHASRRNLTDDQLRAVAARGGLVGVAVQRQLIGGDHLERVADHIVHVVRVVGADHVALGLDMEEVTVSVLPPELRDVRDLPKLTQLLLDRELTDDDVTKVLGLSAFAFFAATLPPG
jgi:microsomal dipeptidase-like Zn-dependent dipeptidase